MARQANSSPRNDALSLCVDIGGTKTALAFYGADGGELFYDKFPTHAELGAERLVREIGVHVRRYREWRRAGRGIVAAPGPLDARGGILLDIVTMGWKNVPVCDLLSRELGLPFSLINDCDAGALGVYHSGYEACPSLVYFSLSTGIGGGAVLGGKEYTGAGNAANFGHIPVTGEGLLCGCGGRDCLELYASGSGIERRYLARTGNALGCAGIEAAARAGDALARQLFSEAGSALGQAAEAVRAVLDPACFVFGGSVCHAWDLMEEQFSRCTRVRPHFADASGKQVLLGAYHYGKHEME